MCPFLSANPAVRPLSLPTLPAAAGSHDQQDNSETCLCFAPRTEGTPEARFFPDLERSYFEGRWEVEEKRVVISCVGVVADLCSDILGIKSFELLSLK